MGIVTEPMVHTLNNASRIESTALAIIHIQTIKAWTVCSVSSRWKEFPRGDKKIVKMAYSGREVKHRNARSLGASTKRFSLRNVQPFRYYKYKKRRFSCHRWLDNVEVLLLLSHVWIICMWVLSALRHFRFRLLLHFT